MFLQSFVLLLPIFIVAAGGFFLTRLFKLSVDTLVRVVTDFFMPFLVFYSLATSEVRGGMLLSLAGATGFIVILLLILSFVYSRVFRLDGRSFIPPIIFMNSGFLGIPLMKLWGGILAMSYIIVYDQVQTILIFTLGILIVTGGFTVSGFKEMLKSPLLWAIVLGFVWNFFGLPFPPAVRNSFEFAGTAATALATFALGASLNGKRFHFSVHLITGLLLRTVVGFFSGVLACIIFGIEGTLKTVILVASALPSAVFSFVLPERYGVDAEYAGTLVVLSTVLGIFTIPLAFWGASVF